MRPAAPLALRRAGSEPAAEPWRVQLRRIRLRFDPVGEELQRALALLAARDALP